MPLRHECTTLHISLEVLEQLTDPKILLKTDQSKEFFKELGEPFKVVSRVQSGTQLGAISLTEVDGKPHILVVKRPNSVIFESLNGAPRSVMTCEDIFNPGEVSIVIFF